jgi:hypothetical protein
VFPLKCAVQTYHWGRIGADSEVAKLSQASDPDFKFDEGTPFAEVGIENSLMIKIHQGTSSIHM